MSTKVRHHPVELVLDVPDLDVLLAWAAAPHKRQAADIVFLDWASRNALETLHMAGAYCVSYRENFASGDTSTGAYQCHITLSDPGGFTLLPGGPGRAFVAPNARAHGVPAAAAASMPASTSVSSCPPAVTAALQKQLELACRSKGVSSKCTKFDACPSLLEKIAITEACILARETIMKQCFGGGDDVHKEEVERRNRGLNNCVAIYERQCGPIPEPAPLPVPHREPSAEPTEHKPDYVVPTTLAGAALFIFYIIRSAFRPGPI